MVLLKRMGILAILMSLVSIQAEAALKSRECSDSELEQGITDCMVFTPSSNSSGDTWRNVTRHDYMNSVRYTNFNHQEYKEETDEDRCSDEYKDYADSVCRSAAGHSLKDGTMMCRFQYGPRDSAMYLAKDPGFVAALAKAVGKKALSWGEIVSESFSLGNIIAENTLARRHEICNDKAKSQNKVDNLDCDQVQKEREYLCSL